MKKLLYAFFFFGLLILFAFAVEPYQKKSETTNTLMPRQVAILPKDIEEKKKSSKRDDEPDDVNPTKTRITHRRENINKPQNKMVGQTVFV